MKKMMVAVTFVVYFIVHIAVSLLLRENDDIVRIVVSALISDVIWHFLYYFVLRRFGKRAKGAEEG